MSRTCVRHPATLITRSSSLARNTKAKLPNAGPREGPAGSIPGAGLVAWFFSGLHPKGFARRVAAGLCSGAGAAGSRPTSSATSMTGTSTHTTISNQLGTKTRVPAVPVAEVADGNSIIARRHRDISISSRRSRRSRGRVRLSTEGGCIVLFLSLTNEGNDGNSAPLPRCRPVVSRVPVSGTGDGNGGNSEVVA